MKKMKFYFALALALLGIGSVANADELTVYDGTNSNEYVPVYGNWADAYLKSEFVIPATDLADMNGATISALKFYFKEAPSKQWTGTFQVFLKEVPATTMSSFSGIDGATIVYEGTFNVVSSQLPIEFTSDYEYQGGNLLVGVYQTVKGNYASSSFYGVGQSYTSAVSGYNSTSLENVSATGRAFIPKTTFTYEIAAEGPAFKVKGFNTGDSFQYPGLVDPKTATTFTLRNPGTEPVTVSIATTGSFSTEETNVEIGAKGEVNISVAAPEAFGTSTGTVVFTPSAGLDAVTINLSATVKDPSKMFVDFSDGALPEDWKYTQYSSSYNWVYTKDDELGGYASYKGSSQSYKGTLTSPVLSFEENEQLYFKTSKYSSSTYASPSVTIQTSTDGETFTDLQTFTDDVYGTWKERLVTIPSGTKYIRFSGWYFNVTHIYGGKILTGAKFVINTKNGQELNFGMQEQNAEATKTYTITNNGSEALTVSIVAPEVVTVSSSEMSIPAKESTELTITLNTTTAGAKNGTVELTTNAIDVTSFSIPVAGYVMDPELFTETFDGNALPDGWTMESGSTYTSYKWTISDGMASATSSNARLITPSLTVAEGEKMAIEAKSYGAGLSHSLPIYVSKNGGEYTLHTTITDLADDFKVFYIEGLEAGNYQIRFDGNSVALGAVNGFRLNPNNPLMEMVSTEAAAFGKVTANASKTYTVKNVGTGELTVNIASDNEAFTVEPAQLVITDEPKDFTVTFNYTEGNYGNFTANITVTPTYNEVAKVTIAASAKAMDPNAWDEDFEGGVMPIGWEASNFSVTTKSYTTNPNTTSLAIASAQGATLVTPRLEAKTGDVLMWEAYCDWSDEGFTVEYSTDDKATWTAIEGYNPYTPQNDGITTRGAKKDMSFKAPADGFYYLRFTSSYSGNGVDNFNGFKLALKEHDATISNLDIRSSFTQYTDHQVSVTVKEMVGKDEEMTAKFFINGTQYGESVTETVPAGGEKEFVVAVRLNEVISGDAYFVVSNENLELTSEKVAITTNPAVVLDETVALEEMPSGYQDKVVVKYTAKKGWNTICLPFALTDENLTALFGEGYKVYEFYQYKDGELGFRIASRRYAGYPYIVYCETVPTIEEPGYLETYVSFTSSEKYDEYNGARFQGTFAPMPTGTMEGKYGVTPAGKIQKGGANAWMKGYRAYFELPEDVNPSKLAITIDGQTIATGIDAVEMLNELNGNVYDLQGRKVNSAKKGIFIQNGKKIVVK